MLSLLCASVFLLSQCFQNNQITSTDPRGAGFAGATTCQQCHQSVYDAYGLSTHYNTTRPVTPETVSGSVASGNNRFHYNDSTYIAIEKRSNEFYQAAYINGQEKSAYRMDIQFGAKHAETFLYWKGEQTFEHPLSFYKSLNGWATSPGYSATQINFNRLIGTNCFQCHSSFVNSNRKPTPHGVEEVLDKSSVILGIDCERCHGPSINHVNYHNAYPEVKEAKYITPIRTLSRQQRLDVCAVCHSGNNRIPEHSTFLFQPGDTLANYYLAWPTQKANAEYDVHGNQSQLLAQSKCFTNAITMDCSTCHNPHANASNNLKAYSAICSSCHQNVTHKTVVETATVQNNCIDCHMPVQPSRAITFQAHKDTLKSAYQLRTHKIAVYNNREKK